MSGSLGGSRPRDRSRSSESQPFGRGDISMIPRLLATLVSLTIIGLGLLAMVTQHFHGRPSAPGGVEHSLEGMAAVVMGLSTVLAGLSPLALWFETRRSALLWAAAFTVSAVIVFVIALRWAP